MSNIKSFADSIVILASPAGARDNGTRLLKVQQLVDECVRLAGDSEEQLAALEALSANVKSKLQDRADTRDFLAEIADTVDTKRRHIQEAA
jgi:hypothetical protein